MTFSHRRIVDSLRLAEAAMVRTDCPAILHCRAASSAQSRWNVSFAMLSAAPNFVCAFAPRRKTIGSIA